MSNVYLKYFGLSETPFAITPDPAFVYLSPAHRDAHAAREAALRDRRVRLRVGRPDGGHRAAPASLLTVDARELCVTCHDNPEESGHAVLHPPALDGGCLDCHDPHGSGRLALLSDTDGRSRSAACS